MSVMMQVLLTSMSQRMLAGAVPFTHDTTVSSRASSSVIDLELQQRGPQGFTGTWAQGPRKGALGAHHQAVYTLARLKPVREQAVYLIPPTMTRNALRQGVRTQFSKRHRTCDTR